MLGVLEEVLGKDAVAGGGGVAGQLLVALEDGLGVAADLDPLGAVGLQGPVRIVLLRLATGAAIATALTLHALEISHVPPFRRPAVTWRARAALLVCPQGSSRRRSSEVEKVPVVPPGAWRFACDERPAGPGPDPEVRAVHGFDGLSGDRESV